MEKNLARDLVFNSNVYFMGGLKADMTCAEIALSRAQGSKAEHIQYRSIHISFLCHGPHFVFNLSKER